MKKWYKVIEMLNSESYSGFFIDCKQKRAAAGYWYLQ